MNLESEDHSWPFACLTVLGIVGSDRSWICSLLSCFATRNGPEAMPHIHWPTGITVLKDCAVWDALEQRVHSRVQMRAGPSQAKASGAAHHSWRMSTPFCTGATHASPTSEAPSQGCSKFEFLHGNTSFLCPTLSLFPEASTKFVLWSQGPPGRYVTGCKMERIPQQPCLSLPLPPTADSLWVVSHNMHGVPDATGRRWT